MYYRSDWPEVGLSAAVNDRPRNAVAPESAGKADWTSESRACGAVFRWIACKDSFETELYGVPVWNIRLETDNLREEILQKDPSFTQTLHEEMMRLVGKPPWGVSYVFSRVVRSEPLYQVLSDCGFVEVEQRRIYKTGVRELKRDFPSFGTLRFQSLAEFPPDQQEAFRRQMFDICSETFGRAGYSRHFTDPFLLKRLSGVSYILAAMRLNFARLSPESFLLAVEEGSARVCGFSILGQKPGLNADMYTQVLSAVGREYQGRDIYSGITQLLVRMLPPRATLLNVTHAGNQAIQTAYKRSGRIHLADTSVVRRVFEMNG